jgi:protein-disulfide isomerase
MAEKNQEKAEYVIGIAVIIAALLVSATIWIASNGITEAISGIKLTGAAAAQPSAPSQPAAPAQPSAPAAPAAVQKLSVDLSKAYFEGKADGKVVMVEYSDFQCPFCSRVLPALDQIKAAYPDMKFIFRNFPLPPSLHPNAQKAAEAAECAGIQGKFWEMHDKLFANQQALSTTDLKKYASDMGLKTADFNTCLDTGATAAKVASELSEGESMGISGTPGFLIYSKSGLGSALKANLQSQAAALQGYGVTASVVEVSGAGYGIVFAGALPYSNFQQIMDSFN